jgi:hypothetical protein
MHVSPTRYNVLHDAPQSRDPHKPDILWARLSSAAFHAALRPRTRAYPRPTNGILVAMTVMNSTLASRGRLAI